MTFALIGHPLSQGYRTRLESALGIEPRYVPLAELRQLRPLRLLRQLISMGGERLYIALEHPQSMAVLPALYCFAALTSARSIELVEPDFARRPVSRWHTVGSLAAATAASVECLRAMRRSRRELARLLRADRIDAPPPRSAGPVLYAKTNMSFAVAAGGSVGHVAGVCGALQQRGYPIDFVGIEPPVMPHREVRFHAAPPPAAYGIPYEGNLYRYQHSFVRDALRVAAGRQYAFVYQRLSLASHAGPLLSRRLSVPLVVEYNGSEVWVQQNWSNGGRYLKLAQQAEQATLRHAHLVVTVSDVLRDELIERGVEPRRIVSHPNGIDPELFDPARYSHDDRLALRRQWNIADDACVACFVGTFGQWHGVDVLAEAIARLDREQADWLRQRRLHFLLVGDGLLMPNVREILRDVDPALYTLTGMTPQATAPAYLAASDVLLSPHVPNADGSRFFGSPTKLFEYMAMGKPIVASRLEQIGEVLQPAIDVGDAAATGQASGWATDSSAGSLPVDHRPALAVLTRPGSVEGLLAGLRLLVDHPELRQQLGVNARREALAKYTWQHHVDAILDRLHQL